MKRSIEPDRVLAHEPQPVKAREQIHASDWIPAVCALVAVVILGLAYISMTGPEPAPERATDTMPVYTFETCHSCATCSDIEDVQFLGRWMDALTKLDATPLEIWDMTHRAFIESRFNPAKVSATGDYGICQINKTAHPDVDVDRLLTDPEYAAIECLAVYRTYTDLCGSDWQCCYKRGHKGCRDWKAGK